MSYKLLVNAITISRIILTIILTVYISTHSAGILPYTVIFLLICLTDLVDGRLARRFSVCTSFGAVLDTLADLFFILAVSSSLVFAELFPVWMLLVYIGKFLEFWATSSFLRRNHRQNHVFMFDSLGRKIAVLFYVLPYIAILLSAFLANATVLLTMHLLCIPITVGAFLSSLSRIRSCIGMRRALV